MRAVRFHAARDVRVEDVPAPSSDLGPNDVLVRPRICGICGSDLREYVAGPIDIPREPHPLTGAHLPQILGHEFSGDVEAVGDSVSAVAPGDRIAVMPAAFCGECSACRAGLPQLCEQWGCVGMRWPWGGLAELAVVREHQAVLLPDGVSYEQGALIEPLAVAVHAASRSGVREGSSVLVTGAGPMGSLSVLAARAAGAAQVFLSEPNSVRAARAGKLGADEVFDPSNANLVAEVRERTNGGVDVAMECSGTQGGLRACLAAARTRGVVAQVGLHVNDASIDATDLTERELCLLGVYAYPVDTFGEIAALIASGRLPADRIVTSTIALDDIVERGLELLGDPTAAEIKILVATR